MLNSKHNLIIPLRTREERAEGSRARIEGRICTSSRGSVLPVVPLRPRRTESGEPGDEPANENSHRGAPFFFSVTLDVSATEWPSVEHATTLYSVPLTSGGSGGSNGNPPSRRIHIAASPSSPPGTPPMARISAFAGCSAQVSSAPLELPRLLRLERRVEYRAIFVSLTRTRLNHRIADLILHPWSPFIEIRRISSKRADDVYV